jgi:hypothetical protein
MQNTHRKTQLIGRAVLVALLAAPAVGAQGRWDVRDQRDKRPDDWDRNASSIRRDEERQLFTWRGTVDDDTRIHVHAGSIQSRVVSGSQRRNGVRVDRDRPLPRREGLVRIQLVEGRGRVHVIQQPSAGNNYTAIVRIKDAQGGAGRYRFAAYFDPIDEYDRRVSRNGRVWDTVGGDVYSGAPAFRWSGSVDGDVRISVRRGQVGYDVLSGQYPQNVSSRVLTSQLPSSAASLGVSVRQGRGHVVVEQQPSQYNNYTAVIRVRDPQGGYGYYDFDLVWR